MSIQFTKSFACSDGNVFGTLALAQQHELSALLMADEIVKEACNKPDTCARAVAAFLIGNASKIVDILTTKASSKPKARAINGGKKARKEKLPNMSERQHAERVAAMNAHDIKQ